MKDTQTNSKPIKRDVIIIGAGAAGLFCAAEAGKRGRSVEVLDHAKRLGGKILMSGGGRCNFTNMYASPENFLSQNPHFCKSALSRYTQWDFIALVNDYKIAHHEKTLGQLFCDESAKDIVQMLLSECAKAKVKVTNRCNVDKVEYVNKRYVIHTNNAVYECESLVVASGGLSMPKLGASPFGYQLATQFDIPIVPTRAALVPFTLHEKEKDVFSDLSGISIDASAACNNTAFNENILFTHRGLSGPAVLQISSYWQAGETVEFNLYPNADLLSFLHQQQRENPQVLLSNTLSKLFPKRFVAAALDYFNLPNKPLKQYHDKALQKVSEAFCNWQLKPNGTEGYRTAEVTLGGVDTDYLSSKTMEAKNQPRLYFIGEVMDVTGWLGGYNFQWAWSSGWVAGQVV